jgi:hypothetical protein
MAQSFAGQQPQMGGGFLQTGQYGSQPVMMPGQPMDALQAYNPMGGVMMPGQPMDALQAYNPMQTASPLGGVMGLGQVMGNQMGLYGQGGPMDGNQQAPQTNMASNLAQMFNQLGGQQPAQQGGTPLQNNSSPLQQSAQLGGALGGVMNSGLM